MPKPDRARSSTARNWRIPLARPWANPYLWAIAVRVILMFSVDRQLQGDASDYHFIAENIASGHGFSHCYGEPYIPTALRPPLYPYLLALVYKSGIDRTYVAIFMNMVFDLLSMRLAKLWGEDLKFKSTRFIPWVIALCPILITYSMFPTTENISILLFFAALLQTFRREPWSAGVLWGLLSLCRPFYLLFPIALFLLPPGQKWARKSLAILVACSMIGPGIWMARNKALLGKATFSHSAGVAWQAYQGICIANFDWWRQDHSAAVMQHPVFSRLVSRAACAPLEELEAIDAEGREVIREWVKDHPLLAARNIVIKGIMLFINWGQTTPYNRISYLYITLVNSFMCFYWWCAFRVLSGRKWGQAPLDDATRFSLVNIAYIVAVTIPFGVDARYLLAPFLSLLICLIEARRSPGALLRAGLEP